MMFVQSPSEHPAAQGQLAGSELAIFLTSALIAIVVTVVVTYVFAKRAFKDQGDRDVLVAAAQIGGLANSIERTDSTVQELADRLRAFENGTTGSPLGTQAMFEGTAYHSSLFERLATQRTEKRGVGKYVRRLMQPGMTLAVDCGTTTAWTFFECLNDGPTIGGVWTNNVFVASFMHEQAAGRQADHFFVEENPSSCILLGGRYYPSYGMTLNDVTDATQYEIPELQGEQLDLILLGTTSIDPATGPRGRSPSNRGFKRYLMTKALADPDTRLLVCLELDKLGLLLGEPCDPDIWRGLLSVPRCSILIGGELDLTTNLTDTRRRIVESLKAFITGRESGTISASLLIIDANGQPTDPAAYLSATNWGA